tara:strand:- start:178 stop:279 length:102 start_codon:yes stop_codon:yes gene_type:complete
MNGSEDFKIRRLEWQIQRNMNAVASNADRAIKV